jgi:peptide/nickel transport system permease protein
MTLPIASPSCRPSRAWMRRLVFLGAALGLAAVLIVPDFLSPYDPFDLAAIDLANSRLPPMFFAAGTRTFLLGTDDQGRDLVSLLIYGTRTTLLVAIFATAIAATIGTVLGLAAIVGGRIVDAGVRRVAEFQLAFPALLVALLLQAKLAATSLGPNTLAASAAIVIAAIAIAGWPEFALGVRAIARTQLSRDYIAAAISIGQSPAGIVRHHLWPAVRGQVLVLSLWTAARAITVEATLSFLGNGLPPQTPSLGRLIRDGYATLIAGEWWVAGPALIVVTALILLLGAIAESLRRMTTPEG